MAQWGGIRTQETLLVMKSCNSNCSRDFQYKNNTVHNVIDTGMDPTNTVQNIPTLVPLTSPQSPF